MKRPKLVYLPREFAAAASGELTPEDYAVYASYKINAAGLFVGNLKIVRKTDGRVVYPFPGAAELGPFGAKQEAFAAATALAMTLVNGDIENPER